MLGRYPKMEKTDVHGQCAFCLAPTQDDDSPYAFIKSRDNDTFICQDCVAASFAQVMFAQVNMDQGKFDPLCILILAMMQKVGWEANAVKASRKRANETAGGNVGANYSQES